MYRDVSHPHLINITPVRTSVNGDTNSQTRGYDNEGCTNTVIASSRTTRLDNSLIWITAKDKSKYRNF